MSECESETKKQSQKASRIHVAAATWLSTQQIFGNRMESHYETQENLRYDCSNRLHIGACDWLQRYAPRGRNEVGFCDHRAVR